MQAAEHEFTFRSLFTPFTTFKAIHWIVIIGLIVFGNILFNGFVVDDGGQIVTNDSVHSVSNIPDIFLNRIQAQETSNYYRPLPYALYAVIYSVAHENTFFYHLIQLGLHIGVSVLIFLIFKKFIRPVVAFSLAVLFLIHPINEETVAYIANLQDVLFVFFGLLSLFLLESISNKSKSVILANIALLLSLFSKELGVLFVFISILYVFLFKKTKRFLHSIYALSVLVFYFLIRFSVHTSVQKVKLLPMLNASIQERLMSIPNIIFYYISTLFYPKNLSVIHTWVIHSIQWSTFYLPLLVDVLFFLLLFSISFFLYKKKQTKLAFYFVSWFVLGLLLHLQIIPIDMTVADHYFYFPLIGLLGLGGLFVSHISLSKQMKQILLIIAVGIMCLLTVRTMVRNTDWSNQSMLIAHDEKVEQNDYLLELLYSTDLIQNNKLDEALPHVRKAISLYPQAWLPWSNLGVIYFEKGKYDLAKQAYYHSISIGNYYGAYENLALLLLRYDSLKKADNFIKKASDLYPTSSKLWYFRVLASYKLKDYGDAETAANHYFNLKQDQQSYTLLQYVKQRHPINIE